MQKSEKIPHPKNWWKHIRIALFFGAGSALGSWACEIMPADWLDIAGLGGDTNEAIEPRFFSPNAILADLEMTGDVYVADQTPAARAVGEQLRYSVGQLNGESSVGNLADLDLIILSDEADTDGLRHIRYQANFPVAWGKGGSLPSTYSFKLPRQTDKTSLEEFLANYGDENDSGACLAAEAHDVNTSVFWYYYRPQWCNIDSSDIVTISAKLSKSEDNTDGRYPDYHRFTEDGEIKIVAVFGRYDETMDASRDEGVRAYNTFINGAKSKFRALPEYFVEPANLPNNPGITYPHARFEATLATGDRAVLETMLVGSVMQDGFREYFEAQTPDADIVMYSGHSGLGLNIDLLLKQARFRSAQYQVFVLNGCDTFAYLNDDVVQRKVALNPDDTTGFKYADFVINAMPSAFADMADQALNFLTATIDTQRHRSYAEILGPIASGQVVGVVGESDNTYAPDELPNLDVGGVLAWRQQMTKRTVALPAGSYRFSLDGPLGRTRGDVDLYVRDLADQSGKTFLCRSEGEALVESCIVQLDKSTRVELTMRGYGRSSGAFVLRSERYFGQPESAISF